MGREVEGRVRMGNTCTPMLIHVNVWQKPPQYCKVISLHLKQVKERLSSLLGAKQWGPEFKRNPEMPAGYAM